jgi:hypothetical protein
VLETRAKVSERRRTDAYASLPTYKLCSYLDAVYFPHCSSSCVCGYMMLW